MASSGEDEASIKEEKNTEIPENEDNLESVEVGENEENIEISEVIVNEEPANEDNNTENVVENEERNDAPLDSTEVASPVDGDDGNATENDPEDEALNDRLDDNHNNVIVQTELSLGPLLQSNSIASFSADEIEEWLNNEEKDVPISTATSKDKTTDIDQDQGHSSVNTQGTISWVHQELQEYNSYFMDPDPEKENSQSDGQLCVAIRLQPEIATKQCCGTTVTGIKATITCGTPDTLGIDVPVTSPETDLLNTASKLDARINYIDDLLSRYQGDIHPLRKSLTDIKNKLAAISRVAGLSSSCRKKEPKASRPCSCVEDKPPSKPNHSSVCNICTKPQRQVANNRQCCAVCNTPAKRYNKEPKPGIQMVKIKPICYPPDRENWKSGISGMFGTLQRCRRQTCFQKKQKNR